MAYLKKEELAEIADSVKLVSINELSNLENYEFDCGIEEYNEFFKDFAIAFDSLNISKTMVLIDKEHNEVIGYITLSSDCISLSSREKSKHGLDGVPFISMPSMKIGKLAINKKRTNKRKGYGSFLLELARGYAWKINESGVACRFITADADVEYDEDTIKFYTKNDFVKNNKQEYITQFEKYKTISMRLDIIADESEEEIDKNIKEVK